MATLYIAEYTRLVSAPNSGPQVVDEGSLVNEQVVSIGANSTQSIEFDPRTRIVRLHCDATCSVLFGLQPVVDASKQRMAANQTEYKGVPEGGNYKVAVISNT